MTRLPADAISVAAKRPVNPAPTTITSASPAIAFPQFVEMSEARTHPDGQQQLVESYGPLADRNVGLAGPSRKILFQSEPVQRAGNTQCEFNLKRSDHLDKMANSKHPLITHHTPPSASKSPAGLNWGRTMKFMLGLLAAVVLLASMGTGHAV